MSQILEQEIRDWFAEGLARKAVYMMLVYDVGEYIHRPIFIYDSQSVINEIIKVTKDALIKLKGVFDMRNNIESQIIGAAMLTNMVKSKICN